MKHLLLIRHATAEQESFNKPDFERQLEKIGLSEAEKLGKYIVSKKIEPALVLASSAARTKATAEIVTEQFSIVSAIKTDLKFYNSNFQILLAGIKTIHSDADCLALVAHNPGISQLATALCQTGSYQMAPSSAVCLRFNVLNWKDITPGQGLEIWYFYP